MLYLCSIYAVLKTFKTCTKNLNCSGSSSLSQVVPNTWAYRAKKERKKKSWKWFGHSFADMCLHNCSKWGGLLRHRVVTTTRIFLEKIAPRAGFYLDLLHSL